MMACADRASRRLRIAFEMPRHRRRSVTSRRSPAMSDATATSRFPLLGKAVAIVLVLMALTAALGASAASWPSARAGSAKRNKASSRAWPSADGARAGAPAPLSRDLAARRGRRQGRKTLDQRRDVVLTALPRAERDGGCRDRAALPRPVQAQRFRRQDHDRRRLARPEGTPGMRAAARRAGALRGGDRGRGAELCTRHPLGRRALGQRNLAVLPGSRLAPQGRGFHAVLPERDGAAGAPLHLESRSISPAPAAWRGCRSATRRGFNSTPTGRTRLSAGVSCRWRGRSARTVSRPHGR